MWKYIHPLTVPLALSVALAAGCAKDRTDNRALNGDSTLSSDLQLANRDTTAQPQLRDIPARDSAAAPAAVSPAPARTRPPAARSRTTAPSPRRAEPPSEPAPAPTPAAPTTTPSGNTIDRGATGTTEGRATTIPAGSIIALSSSEKVCTNTKQVGDKFTATVSQAAAGANGAMIPVGSTAVVEVTSVKRSQSANDPAQIGLVVQRISVNGKSFPVDASIDHVQVTSERVNDRKSDATKVIGGAVAGAILGQIIGHNTKGTVIGAATGAAAGTAVAMGTAAYNGCIPQGGEIRIRLNAPLQVTSQ